MIEHSPAYLECKERYHLAWQDWYYWPLEDESGNNAARERMEAVGKELSAIRKMEQKP